MKDKIIKHIKKIAIKIVRFSIIWIVAKILLQREEIITDMFFPVIIIYIIIGVIKMVCDCLFAEDDK